MAFQPHSSFDALASVIEQLGADGRTVRRAEATAGDGDDALCATVDVAVPLSALASDTDEGSVPLEPLGDTDDGEGFAFALGVPGIDPVDVGSGEGTDVTVRAAGASLDSESLVATLEIVIRSAESDDRPSVDVRAGAPEPETEAEDGSFRRGGTPTSGGSERAPHTSDVTAVFDGSSTGDDERGGESETADEGERTGDDPAIVRDESVPPYEDVAYLRRLYEVCDTFAEMSERIEMDVSAETVRRYMIDAEVHSPMSYELGDAGPSPGGEDAERGSVPDGETDNFDGGASDSSWSEGDTDAGDGADESDEGRDAATTDAASGGRAGSPDRVASESLPDEQLVADGIGLPEELTLSDVVEAVVDARTVYEVQRELDLGPDRTRQLLRQLNVLDLVLCRASQAAVREVTVETVAGRIRQCTPDSA